jgi:hypothetical protein
MPMSLKANTAPETQSKDNRKLKVRFTEWQKAKSPFIAERAFLNVVGERGLLHLRCRPAGRC